jgi:hypothetical protein
MPVASLRVRFRRLARSPSFKPTLSAITVRRDLAAIATMLGVMSIIGTADALASASVSNSPGAPPALDAVTVESRPHDRDEKPYRNLLKAITVFEENRRMAPEAVMRFKVFPWRNPSVMQGLTLTLSGRTIRRDIALADDGSFTLERDLQALDDSAWVVSNRTSGSLVWRADIRTPGLPANTRRLGDLRLECKVDVSGTGADLATSIKTPAFWAIAAVSDPCMNRGVGVTWIADEPIFSVTLVSGARRRTLPCDSIYGCKAPPIFDFMDWHEHLRDRAYWLPIWDTSWPDDTLVVLEPMNCLGANADGEAR